jgi:putative membrane protein insertion efficiency factor
VTLLRRLRSHRRLLLAAAVLAALLTLDLLRSPERQLSAKALLWSIDVYQATLSPALARGGARCRFEPSCSVYAEGAIRDSGALVGAGRAVWRVMRCGPWTEVGTVDPP